MKGGIKITCSCGKQIVVPPAMAGLNIRCRKCWNTMRVPRPDGSTLPDRRAADRREGVRREDVDAEPSGTPAASAQPLPKSASAGSSESPRPMGAYTPAGIERRENANRRWTDRRSTPVIDPDASRLHRRVWAKGSEAVKSSFLAKVILVLAVLGIAFCVYMGIRAFSRESVLEPLRPHLAEYLAAGSRSASKPVNIYAIKGRVVAVDLDARDFDPIYFALPARMRAERHEDVGTVVQVKKEGAEWSVRFVDLKSGQETLNKRFKSGGTSGKPAKDIVDFILTVPKK